MDFCTLDENFEEIDQYENFKSLVWAERYDKRGDFLLESLDIDEAIRMFPEDSFVGLRDSTVPMIVETHKILEPEGTEPSVLIAGRTVESVLERRGSINQSLPLSAAKAIWSIDSVKESDIAYAVLRSVLGDKEVVLNTTTNLPLLNPAASPLDEIEILNIVLPQDFFYMPPTATKWADNMQYYQDQVVKYASKMWKVKVSNMNSAPTESNANWELISPYKTVEIKAQRLDKTVDELIAANHHGLKATRGSQFPGKLDLEIYNGVDLTEEVIFDARFDEFDSTEYLLSSQGSANVAYVYGANGAQMVLKTMAAEPSGLARRVIVVDETSSSSLNSEDTRKARGLVELYNNNVTALFGGQLSQDVVSGYNDTYFLGDIIKLNGSYGLSQNARVIEYIRTQDDTGEKAYPTLESVDPDPTQQG